MSQYGRFKQGRDFGLTVTLRPPGLEPQSFLWARLVGPLETSGTDELTTWPDNQVVEGPLVRLRGEVPDNAATGTYRVEKLEVRYLTGRPSRPMAIPAGDVCIVVDPDTALTPQPPVPEVLKIE